MSGGGGAEAPKIPGYVNKATKPYAKDLANFGQNYDPQFYGGQMTAGMDPYTQNATQDMGGFDTQGSQDYLQQSMQGDFLGLNPQMRAAVMDPAMDSAAARFNSMGRYGSPASQQSMAQAGMQAAMPYYNQERDRQQQSAMQLPAMQQMQNQQQLMGGQINEGYAQNQINEDMSRFNFEQNQPYDIMQRWSSLYGPLSQASPVGGGVSGGSDLAGGLGGVLTGAAAGGALAGTKAGAFLGPWGMAGGAALGGLAGLLGS